MRILIADCDSERLNSLLHAFKTRNYSPEAATGSADVLRAAQDDGLDGFVLCDTLGSADASTVIDALRGHGNTAPILVYGENLTADRATPYLDAGADGCVKLPASDKAFFAHVRAMLRRRDFYTPNTITVEGLTLSRNAYTLSTKWADAKISGKEFSILEMLMERIGTVVTADELTAHIWGPGKQINPSVIWVHISNLRRLLRSLDTTVGIRFVRGAGYSLTTDEK